MKSSSHWKKELQLEPHPEGGWFRRIYESGQTLEDGRPQLTSIYYLLEAPDFSALHRLQSDEQWHFYAGSPITIHEIDPDGHYHETILGAGAFQHTVRAGHLFGATVGKGYALVGCSVVPGFDFAEFEMPSRFQLLEEFPDHYALITLLTR
ncbi:cupin domain-containing protein [Pontiellaceae bacterium B12219]|nr:cupin domain-containing protein [Pontiellaceae bacterium B12219]